MPDMSVRAPIAAGYYQDEESGTIEFVTCDDGSIWTLHYGDMGPDGWREGIPIPGTRRAIELTGGTGHTAVAESPICDRCKGFGVILGRTATRNASVSVPETDALEPEERV